MNRSKSRKRTKKRKENPSELQAFIKHSSELHAALNDGVLIRLTWDLCQNEVLSQAAVSNITHEMLSESAKATKLVGTLLKSIRADNSKFIPILKCCSTYLELKPVVTRIRQDYKLLCDIQPGFKSGEHTSLSFNTQQVITFVNVKCMCNSVYSTVVPQVANDGICKRYRPLPAKCRFEEASCGD